MVGLFTTLIGLFNVTAATQGGETIRVSGADIACSSLNTGEKTRCIGQYERGWPVGIVDGAVVVRDDGRVNDSTQLLPFKALYNVMLIGLLTYLIFTVIERKRET